MAGRLIRQFCDTISFGLRNCQTPAPDKGLKWCPAVPGPRQQPCIAMPPKPPLTPESAAGSRCSKPSMAQARSVKQVLALLSKAAGYLSKPFHVALCLWLQLQEELQQHKVPSPMHSLIPFSVELAQAAQHAAPKCASEMLQLAWMMQHVPIFSKAVAACVVAQAGVSLKRVRILQQLLSTQRDTLQDQLAARLSSEVACYWHLVEAGRIAVLLAPLAPVVEVLCRTPELLSKDVTVKGQRNQQLLAYQQADDLLSDLAVRIHAEKQRIMQPIDDARQVLMDVCLSLDPDNKNTPDCQDELGRISIRVQSLHALASMIWLWFALHLPPNSKQQTAQAWLNTVDMGALASAPSIMCPQHLRVMTQRWVSCALARPDLHVVMTGEHMQSQTCQLLLAFGVQHQHLCDAGVAEEEAKRLMLLVQQAYGQNKTEATMSGSQRHVAVDGASCGTAAHTTAEADDGRLDDMQALLELMYGTLDVKL